MFTWTAHQLYATASPGNDKHYRTKQEKGKPGFQIKNWFTPESKKPKLSEVPDRGSRNSAGRVPVKHLSTWRRQNTTPWTHPPLTPLNHEFSSANSTAPGSNAGEKPPVNKRQHQTVFRPPVLHYAHLHYSASTQHKPWRACLFSRIKSFHCLEYFRSIFLSPPNIHLYTVSRAKLQEWENN